MDVRDTGRAGACTVQYVRAFFFFFLFAFAFSHAQSLNRSLSGRSLDHSLNQLPEILPFLLRVSSSGQEKETSRVCRLMNEMMHGRFAAKE